MKTLNLILRLIGCAFIVLSGGTILFIMYHVYRRGYIKIIEDNRTILLIECAIGLFAVLLGFFLSIQFCLEV